MVEKFEKILEKIKSEKGPLTFFGIFKMDELTDKWSVLLSATWASEHSKRIEAFEYLLDLLRKNLTSEEARSIARIGVFSNDEHLIDLLLNFQKGSRIREQSINGNIIHDGYVLEANRIVESEIVPIPDY
ncbi:hypothetical protein HY416_03945 [Candidatus Kaiserbacteria bacterium]|nr:hypothetical protein [Candidatus Kaiserbacteria bacterium]